MIKHYIEDKSIIPALLEQGWIIRNNTWTDCPLYIQKLFKKQEKTN